MWNSLLLQSERAAARLPDGLRIYAIGDIHGRADLLAALLRQIDVDCTLYPSSRPILVFVGDYIDRGPASREVLDLLLGCEPTKEAVFLKGNHETFVHRFLSEPAVLDEWRLCGGLETLVSYGLRPSINPGVAEQRRLAKELAKAIPKRHLEFLESLNPSFSCGDFLFVHAGIRPGVPIRKQREEDLLWIREEFFSCEQRCEKFVVHGHTPVPTPDFRSNRINIDTGAFATGRLTCIVIESTSIVELIDVRDCNTASIPRCSEYTDEDRACRVDLATQISPDASRHNSRGPVHSQVDGENAFSVARFRLLALLRILGCGRRRPPPTDRPYYVPLMNWTASMSRSPWVRGVARS